MTYNYITVQAIPQELDLILDDNSTVNKGIEKETKMALAAPELVYKLEVIKTLAESKDATAEYLVDLIASTARGALKLVGK